MIHPLICASLSESRVTDDSFPKRATYRYTDVYLLDCCMQIFLPLSRVSPDDGNMNHAAMRGRCLITGNQSPCAILQIQTKPDAFPFIPPFSFFIDRLRPTCAKKASRLSKRGNNIGCERISINNFYNVEEEHLSLSLYLSSVPSFSLSIYVYH